MNGQGPEAKDLVYLGPRALCLLFVQAVKPKLLARRKQLVATFAG